MYTRPFKRWDKSRLNEEAKLLKIYGLKNKRELWKAKDIVRKFRARARRLFTEETGREELFAKLQKLGIFTKDATLDDILGMKVEDILERRLQTLVLRKGLTHTPTQARQVITHRHITINGTIVDIPGHIVTLEEEKSITYSNNSVLKDEKHPLRIPPKQEGEKKEEKPEEAPKAETKPEPVKEEPKAEPVKEEKKPENKKEAKTTTLVEEKTEPVKEKGESESKKEQVKEAPTKEVKKESIKEEVKSEKGKEVEVVEEGKDAEVDKKAIKLSDKKEELEVVEDEEDAVVAVVKEDENNG